MFFLRSNLSEFLFKKIIYHLASGFPDSAVDDNVFNARRAEENQYGSAGPSPAKAPTLDEVDTPLLNEKLLSQKLD